MLKITNYSWWIVEPDMKLRKDPHPPPLVESGLPAGAEEEDWHGGAAPLPPPVHLLLPVEGWESQGAGSLEGRAQGPLLGWAVRAVAVRSTSPRHPHCAPAHCVACLRRWYRWHLQASQGTREEPDVPGRNSAIIERIYWQ